MAPGSRFPLRPSEGDLPSTVGLVWPRTSISRPPLYHMRRTPSPRGDARRANFLHCILYVVGLVILWPFPWRPFHPGALGNRPCPQSRRGLLAFHRNARASAATIAAKPQGTLAVYDRTGHTLPPILMPPSAIRPPPLPLPSHTEDLHSPPLPRRAQCTDDGKPRGTVRILRGGGVGGCVGRGPSPSHSLPSPFQKPSLRAPSPPCPHVHRPSDFGPGQSAPRGREGCDRSPRGDAVGGNQCPRAGGRTTIHRITTAGARGRETFASLRGERGGEGGVEG